MAQTARVVALADARGNLWLTSGTGTNLMFMDPCIMIQIVYK